MKGLILAGGNGTRLRPLTHTGPKQLIPIANKPNILYCLEDLRDAGITDIGIILGNNMPDMVRELLKDGSEFGVRITYIEQGEPKGIAHAVGCAEEFMGDEPFVVYLGDNILQGGIRYMVDEFSRGDMEALVALTPVDDPTKFGIAELDAEGNLIGLEEKPERPRSDLAMVGIYFLRSSIIIKKLKPSEERAQITEAIDPPRRPRSWRARSGMVKTPVVGGHHPRQPHGAGRDEGKGRRYCGAGATLEGEVTGRGNAHQGRFGHPGPAIIGKNCPSGPTRIGPRVSATCAAW